MKVNNLDPEILRIIFSNASFMTQCRFRRVCTKFNNIYEESKDRVHNFFANCNISINKNRSIMYDTNPLAFYQPMYDKSNLFLIGPDNYGTYYKYTIYGKCRAFSMTVSYNKEDFIKINEVMDVLHSVLIKILMELYEKSEWTQNFLESALMNYI